MAYFMIYVRDERSWSPQFGDKDLEAVKQEVEDSYLKQPGTAYEGDGKYRAQDIKRVRFDRVPTKRQVEEKTFELNMKEAGI